MTQAFPLQWPEAWPRTDANRRDDGSGKFIKRSGFDSRSITLAEAVGELVRELDLLGAQNLIVSTNIEPRLDGMPRSGQAIPDDPGIAIYFSLGGNQKVMARDAYLKPEHNVRSLCLAIEGLRQLERHGGGTMMEKAFSGFDALPAPSADNAVAKSVNWFDVLGCNETDDRDTVQAAYRQRVKEVHPDQGGSYSDFHSVQEAWKLSLIHI